MKFVYLSLLATLPFFAAGQVAVPDQNYPLRIPDWLWRDSIRAAFIDPGTRAAVEFKIKERNWANSQSNQPLVDNLDSQINVILNSNFSMLDLSRGATVVGTKLQLAIQLQPDFSDAYKKVLLEGARIYLDIALDDEVIREAYDSSIPFPTPMPPMYDSASKNKGPFKKYSDDYVSFLNSRSQPASIAQFKKQLLAALTTPTGDPVLMALSAYTGDHWWGGTYYNFYYLSLYQLSKSGPSQGYLYTRFNTDSLATNADPYFWACKFGHEILHSLDYWHPGYFDVPERDRNNIGSHKAFIVAYEFAILKKARQLEMAGRK